MQIMYNTNDTIDINKGKQQYTGSGGDNKKTNREFTYALKTKTTNQPTTCKFTIGIHPNVNFRILTTLNPTKVNDL